MLSRLLNARRGDRCWILPTFHPQDVESGRVYLPFSTDAILDGWKQVRPRFWYHPFHRMSSFLGRFPQGLVRYFITKFTLPGQVILDPFCGCGTVPFESILLGRRGLGCDSFLYATTLSAAKVEHPPKAAVLRYLRGLSRRLAAECLDQNLIEKTDEPLARHLLIYYHPRTLHQLKKLRALLLSDLSNAAHERQARFIQAVVCGILHGDSTFSLSLPTQETWSASPEYVRRFAAAKGLVAPDRDVIECIRAKLRKMWAAPLPTRHGRVWQADVTSEGIALPRSSVHFVLTSPPYLSVRDYPLDNWIRLWFLGSSVNRERGRLLATARVDVYETRMQYVLKEMFRILRDNAVAVIVVADVTKFESRGQGGTTYRSAERLASMATKVGFGVVGIIEDNIDLKKRTGYFFHYKKALDDKDIPLRRGVRHDRILILSKGEGRLYDDLVPDYSTCSQLTLSIHG